MLKKYGKRVLALLLGLSLLMVSLTGLSGCGMQVKAESLMAGITPHTGERRGREPDEVFQSGTADFAVRLFKASCNSEKNSLISPLSVMLALSMTANGARGETLSQMEHLFGDALTRDRLNEYWSNYRERRKQETEGTLKLADSIWIKDVPGFTAEREFLQKNADYYGAAAYKAAFDEQTLTDINRWVSQNTDGQIPKILDRIQKEEVMYLINTVLFEAEWQEVYQQNQVRDGVFTTESGRRTVVSMMESTETRYLNDGKATGFVKLYRGNYRFVALLPNEGVPLKEYVDSLTGEGLLSTVRNAQTAQVQADLPKFSYDYAVEMSKALTTLGMTDAFQKEQADFRDLGHVAQGNLYVGRVLHKAHIEVGEQGTKAGAATVVPISSESALLPHRTVTLNRPFVYAILDNTTDLPLFIGTVTELSKQM